MVKPYLSICACYRWEGPFLREWVAFHRVVGVEHFFLYDNDSDDEHLEALAPYLEEGTVQLRHWPQYPDGQTTAWEHLLAEHPGASRWIAFMDVDEFLYSPRGLPLPEILARYERWPGVGVNQVLFGPSGHATRPAGLVVENYTRRLQITSAHRPAVKSIVDPQRATRPLNSHEFAYTEGHAVDENEQPLDGRFARSESSAELRINHYYTKSDEENVVKHSRPSVSGSMRPGANFAGKALRQERLYGTADDGTIQRWLPALRAELERVAR